MARFVVHGPDQIGPDWHIFDTLTRDAIECASEGEARGYCAEMNADPTLFDQARPEPSEAEPPRIKPFDGIGMGVIARSLGIGG